jgi:hypothetical protein
MYLLNKTMLSLRLAQRRVTSKDREERVKTELHRGPEVLRYIKEAMEAMIIVKHHARTKVVNAERRAKTASYPGILGIRCIAHGGRWPCRALCQ